MHTFDFDSNFIQQANAMSSDQSEMILKGMFSEKKKILTNLLEDMAKSDGFVHEKEMTLIIDVCSAMGIASKAVLS